MWAFTAPTQKIKPKVLGKVDIPIWNAEMKKPPVFRLMAFQFWRSGRENSLAHKMLCKSTPRVFLPLENPRSEWTTHLVS